ncbi:protein-L-isoaspartate O-methyltransferase family protein [Janibacter alittae]|uniref:Protein-L-isoaspartate O-methyltransferase n=1 Tax=Janibacter alittae TaxID=3115209 RepID=A0ABZ2MJL8_9MICO
MGADDVERAFDRVPRTAFLREGDRERAGEDRPIDIGDEQTNSQPSTVAAMLRLLDVRPGHVVLDLGSGSGWTTALLGELVGARGTVIGVERIPRLVETSRAALAGFDRPWARVRRAEPDVLGAPDHAPFDRILVSAEANRVPAELVDQLAPEGVMVMPVAGEMVRVVNRPRGPEMTTHGRYRFVPLVT